MFLILSKAGYLRTMIMFTIPGKPQPKERPRVTRSGYSFTPQKTKDYEAKVREEAKKSKLLPQSPIKQTPLKMILWCYMGIPKSWSKKKTALAMNGTLKPYTRPDIDNLGKIVMDALNGVAYEDDSQIVQLVINKVYSDEPRVEVLIDEMN